MPRKHAIIILAVVAAAYLVWTSTHSLHTAQGALLREQQLASVAAKRIATQAVVFTSGVVKPGLGFTESLLRMGVDSTLIYRMVEVSKPIFDFRHFRAGNYFAVGRAVSGELKAVQYQIDNDRMLSIKPKNGDFQAVIQTIPSTSETARVQGVIKDSLFNAVQVSGEAPELALRLADIFGWDLDFYTDPQKGDVFRVVVEKKKYPDGQVTYGKILAAEYVNAAHPYRAVLFHDPEGNPSYYAPDGKSMKKAFLHSPLRFAAPITSHFSHSRFHPILKIYRPHLGIDYGAPTGTPVQTIGDGTVVSAGWHGGAGKAVVIRHANGFETSYYHLSAILVRGGQRVTQGERIGLVGATGLATGPHLDFRIKKQGALVNFLRLQLPPSEPVAQRDRQEFAQVCNHWLGLLPSNDTHLAQVAAPNSRKNP